MGPPKQKWTSEEEASLRAGVTKYGVGKWRAILKDPQFGPTLCCRSNVDLKDKWRNMNFTGITSGSREKGKTAVKKSRSTPKNDFMAISTVTSDINDKIVGVKPLAVLPTEALNASNPEKPQPRLGNIIMEAVKNLNEPTGSSRTTIANYIEEQHWPSSDFDHLLSAKLKDLTTSGKLMKVKQKYRVAPAPISPLSDGRSPKMLLLEDLQEKPSEFGRDDSTTFTRSQVDAELAHIATLSAEEAAAAANHAVAEAEAIMAEAEAAAREAEAAEADAQAAQAFAEAALLTFKNRNATKSVPKV